MKSTILISGAAVLVLFACAKQPDNAVKATSTQTVAAMPAAPSATEPAALPPGHPDVSTAANRNMPPAMASSAGAGNLTGTVLETMNSGGYTYMKLNTPSGNIWTAVRETKVKTGATVALNAQMTMENFESTTLHRKFDRIVFGSIASPVAAAAPATMAQAISNPMSSPMGSAQQHMAAPPAANVVVEKATGPDAKTIAEIWSGKDSLKDKNVVVRGKVVKALSGIMGKNWIHLRDGSGSREQGTDDITVTTSGSAAVGDIVVVAGTLRADKDFGAGYVYSVIIEDAKLQQ